MELTKLFCYFSPVAKGATESIIDKIKYTEIEESHDVYFKMLQLLDSVKKECDLNIIFSSNGEKQKNDTRDMSIEIVDKTSIESGLPLI